ncbi:MAG TPA: hypothetical protein PK467_04780 [Candidatus Wallbacteria bacterium]|nr:hypothetical protein [Candidatus Wallbacteria bacterium]
MNFLKNVSLVFKSYLWHIISEYKNFLFFLIALSLIYDLIFFLKFSVPIDNKNTIIKIWSFEVYFNSIFFYSNMMAIITAMSENPTQYFEKFIKNGLTIREIITGKIMAIYVYIVITTFILFATEFLEFIKINLLINSLSLISLLLTLLICIFFYCTINTLIASLKNKKLIIIACAFIIAYTLYSLIPLTFYEKSPSIMYAIIFGHYSSIEISSVIKYSYLPVHLILSITLIYFVSPFVENK